MTWYSELGFKNNPLDIRPNPNLIGLEKQEKQLKNHILKEEICFLNGLTGCGKSSLLLKVQKTLKKHTFIYLDAQELPTNFNLEEELKKKRNFFDKITFQKFPKKKPVLIIDEFQSTNPNLILQARASWENPIKRKIKSIVIAQISKYLTNVSDSFKERLGSRIVVLNTLDEDEMINIIKKRLDKNKKKISEKIEHEALLFIAKCSGNNPRRMLEYVDELFDFHHRKFNDKNPILKDGYKITYYGAKEILGLDKVLVDGFAKENKEIENSNELNFDNELNEKELEILKIINKKPITINELSNILNTSKSNISKHIKILKRKKCIIYAGKKDRFKKWQISPSTKRILVKE
ncbi:MAG: AAA family ATPase [Candidatus Woesearchaeota archaeon]